MTSCSFWLGKILGFRLSQCNTLYLLIDLSFAKFNHEMHHITRLCFAVA